MPDYKLTVTKSLDYQRPEIEKGYTDQTLHIDISNPDISIQPVAQKTKNTFVGGKGYDLWLLWNAVQADTRCPVGPCNRVAAFEREDTDRPTAVDDRQNLELQVVLAGRDTGRGGDVLVTMDRW